MSRRTSCCPGPKYSLHQRRSAHGRVLPSQIKLFGATTRVLVEQIGAIDSGRLGELVGHVSLGQQRGIDEAVPAVLGRR